MNANAVTETKPGLSGIAQWPAKIKEYVQDLRTEMRRVTWPTPQQVRGTTAAVIIAVFLFAAYFAVVDLLLGRAVNQIFETLARR
jgi:preprotein translocase subunit SecE